MGHAPRLRTLAHLLLPPPAASRDQLKSPVPRWCLGPYLASPPSSCPATRSPSSMVGALAQNGKDPSLAHTPHADSEEGLAAPDVPQERKCHGAFSRQSTGQIPHPPPDLVPSKSWHEDGSALGCPSQWLGAAGPWEGNISDITQVAGWG